MTNSLQINPLKKANEIIDIFRANNTLEIIKMNQSLKINEIIQNDNLVNFRIISNRNNETAIKLIQIILAHLVDSLKLNKCMSISDLMETAAAINEEFPHLTPEDLILFCKNYKNGNYSTDSELWVNINQPKMILSLRKYDNLRDQEIFKQKQNEKAERHNDLQFTYAAIQKKYHDLKTGKEQKEKEAAKQADLEEKRIKRQLFKEQYGF